MTKTGGGDVFSQFFASALRVAALACIAMGGFARADVPQPGKEAVRTYCAGCHTEVRPDQFQRVSEARKTPEGWLMTVVRMQHAHGVSLPEGARDAIVKYLADTQGLAPSETQSARAFLERQPNLQHLKVGDDLQPMCGRCHSLGRVVLQRRTTDEWLKLMHFHVGQFPTLEYQSGSRDRFWWQEATTQLPSKLGTLFPLDTPAWREWQQRTPSDLAGKWVVYGRSPGRGSYVGTMQVSAAASGGYLAEYLLRFANQSTPEARSSVVRVYTGYEWRGSSGAGDQSLREVYALSEDGRRLKGRWFFADHVEMGGDLIAERADGAPSLLAVLPRALKIGATHEVQIVGRGLQGQVSFGPGTKSRILSQDATSLRVAVTVDAKTRVGERDVRVGSVEGKKLAVVYNRVARVDVSPAFGVARVGGGRVPPVTAQFEAFGFAAADSKGATEGMIALGPLDAAWSVEPFNQTAVEWEDLKFAGAMEPSGRFVPGPGGPNPARRFSTNNSGELKVIATLPSEDAKPRGEAHLIVTVQRWISPPIE